MTVAVAEFEGFDASRACVDSIADCAGIGGGKSGFAILSQTLYSALNQGAEKASRAR